MQKNKENFEEKYKEKIDEMCKWLNYISYLDPNTYTVKLIGFKTIDDLIECFRKKMEIK